MIYFDNNATTHCDPEIADLYHRILIDKSITNPHSQHIGGWRGNDLVEQSKNDISQIFNMLPDDVIFTSGATESNNLAILGVAHSAYLNKTMRRKIIVSSIEHKCVLNSAFIASQIFDFELCICPINHEGYIDLNQLEAMIDDSVLLVSIMAVNNEIGSVQPFEIIGQMCKKFGVIFHTDAAQAAYETIDMIQAGIDMLSLSGHKQYCPIGIGCLLVDEMISIKPNAIIHGGNQQNGLRSGTISPANSLVLASALKKNTQLKIEDINHLEKLRSLFLELLSQSEIHYQVNTPLKSGAVHPGNLNISFTGHHNHDLISKLQPQIACSTGSACNNGIIEQSYVLRAMGLDTNRIDEAVRFCFGRFNTEKEVIKSVSILLNYLKKY